MESPAEERMEAVMNINVMSGWGNLSWWTQQQQKKAAEAAQTEPVPTRCEFCIKPICEGDTYYIGYDSHKIFAMTCTDHRCKQWLKYKAIRRKPWTL
jgi:hypothetical protein